MRVSSKYPVPIDGVSTTQEISRKYGYAEEQINMRSNPIAKLTRRPSLEWEYLAAASTATAEIHSYVRRGITYRLIIDSTGTVKGYRDDVEVTVNNALTSSYLQGDLAFTTIYDTTFVANKDVIVAAEAAPTTITGPKVCYINIVDAMNYRESLTIDLQEEDGTEVLSITLSVYAATHIDADAQRATNQVAADIAAAINGTYVPVVPIRLTVVGSAPNMEAIALGSCVAIYMNTTGIADVDQNRVITTVSSGQGEGSVVVISPLIESTEGLPKYAIDGTVVTVQPNPTSDKGVYYLKATPTTKENNIQPSSIVQYWNGTLPTYSSPFTILNNRDITYTIATYVMQEVIWNETTAPLEANNFVASTMPHTITYDHTSGEFSVEEREWQERKAGDNVSNSFPSFIGTEIKGLSYFQKRLVMLSENEVHMTETDNIFNWFRKSAAQLLVTDPIGISPSASDVDILEHVIPHNRDLLVLASNAQFKIPGTPAATPQTVSMGLTTAYNCQTVVAPVSIGDSVFIPTKYGDSTGMLVYDSKTQNNKDQATSVTDHVIGYMSGNITNLVSSSNLGMMLLTTDNTPDNVVFVYEEEVIDGERQQTAWSKWEFPTDDSVISVEFENDVATFVINNNDDLHIKTINMFSESETNINKIFLDDLIYIDHNITTVTLPTDYSPTGDVEVVCDEASYYPYVNMKYTRIGDVLTFDEPIAASAGKVYIGTSFSSNYRPTRPFMRDENGTTYEAQRIRVNRWKPTIVETADISFKIISEFSKYGDQNFNARLVNRINNLVGVQPLHSGTIKFGYSQNAHTAKAEFYTDGHLNMTIANIEWDGQYKESARRI